MDTFERGGAYGDKMCKGWMGWGDGRHIAYNHRWRELRAEWGVGRWMRETGGGNDAH